LLRKRERRKKRVLALCVEARKEKGGSRLVLSYETGKRETGRSGLVLVQFAEKGGGGERACCFEQAR